MTTTRITHIGGPTALIEVGGWWRLTDPTVAPPGRRYSFGWGSSSHKLTRPAIAATDLGPIDAVLVSHDRHGDNLDSASRALLPAACAVLTTTTTGAGRLGGNARGLQPSATTLLEAPGRPTAESPHRPGTWSASPWAGKARRTGPCGSPATPCCTTASARSPTASRSTPPAPPGMRALPGHRAGPLQHGRPGGRRAVPAGPPPHRHPRPLRGLDPLPPRARCHQTAIRAGASIGIAE